MIERHINMAFYIVLGHMSPFYKMGGGEKWIKCVRKVEWGSLFK